MKINILGAGMSGLLAANMLRRHDITIIEKKKELPNNHHAVLRFKTPEVGNILGIPFKKVNMIKTHVSYGNVVADSLAYSRKTTGQFLSNRSIIDGTVTAERYIAPRDLISQMAKDVKINYNSFEYTDTFPHISTIPMPMLMNILDYSPIPEFKSKPGVVFTGRILDCDAYVSVLFPGPDVPYSRATITGDQLIVEFPNCCEVPDTIDLAHVYYHLGLHDSVVLDGAFKHQDFFKIIEIDDSERKKFMRWATVNFNIYSLGRYSTWRPKLLLDDLIKDVRKIESWILGGR